MLSILEWLLDLDNIRLARDAPILFRWDTNLQPWMLFGIALGAAAWIAILYRRERTSVARRVFLAVSRGLVVGLIIAVWCGPSVVLQRNRVEPSFVAMLIDTSMSMSLKDVYRNADLVSTLSRGAGLGDDTQVSELTRQDLIRAALNRDDAAAFRALLGNNGVQLYTFSGSVETGAVANAGSSPEALSQAVAELKADGRSSDIANAIKHVIDQAQGRRLAAIILASDGQATHLTKLKDAMDAAADRQVPVYALRVGSPDPVFDIEVGPVRAQESVFANDIMAVEAQITSRGLSEVTEVTVRLVDERTSTVVASQIATLTPDSSTVTVELQTKPTQSGRQTYRAEVVRLPGETLPGNNAERVQVIVLENRLRVLYVDGYPRFEYRYLKNALLREPTIELSVLLLEADEQFVQEGTDPIRRFPESPEELSRFDVVLFGDVDPRGGWLTGPQMNMLVNFVGNEGGGFGFITGERIGPHRFIDTPLEKLIPVRIDPAFQGRYERPLLTGFQAAATIEGRRSRLFRFSPDRQANEQLLQTLPDLYWIARTLGAKPGATVIAEHLGLRTDNGFMPLVVTGRYGAGKLFFQATDDTWRWRRHTGELLHDAYWVQVVRDLMPATRMAGDRRYVLRTDRRAYDYGASVRVQAELFDAEMLAQQKTINIRLTRQDSGGAADSPEERPGSAMISARVELHRTGEESNLFEGTLVPAKPGAYVLEAEDLPHRPGETKPSVGIRVERPDLEFCRSHADHELLERIATATGGQVVDLDRLEVEFSTIRDRSVQIPDDITESLWDSKLVLLLFTLMISTEWVLRKAFGLM